MKDRGQLVLSFLAKLKGRKRSLLPKEPETYVELMRRICRRNRAAEIRKLAYFEFLSRGPPPLLRLLHCYFKVIAPEKERVVFFWLENAQAFACKLLPQEKKAFGKLFQIEPFYEPDEIDFPLEAFLPGEKFFTEDRKPAQRAREKSSQPGFMIVWLKPESINARKEQWPKDKQVFATSAEQARRISRRIKYRRRRAREKVEAVAACGS